MGDSWTPSHTLRLARLAHPGRDWQPMPLEPLMAIRSDPGLPHGVMVYFNADSLDDLARAEWAVINRNPNLGAELLGHTAQLLGNIGAAFATAEYRRRALIAVLDAHPEIETPAPLNGEDHED